MKKFLCLFLALIMMLCVFTACGGDANTTTTTEAETTQGTTTSGSGKDTVIVRCEQIFFTMHPLEGIPNFPNLYVLDQVYEALTRVDDNGVVQPRLAESWEMAEDAQSVKFKIREGVKFHNGEELKASDVVFTYELAMQTPATNLYTNKIDRVEANGDYEVTIYLKAPSSSFISSTAEIYIMNEKYYNEVGGNLMEQGCGTGPYKFVSVDLSNEIQLEAFDEYWECDVPIKHAIIRSVTDSTTSAVSFEAGELDYMQVSNISAYPQLADSGNFNTELVTTLHTAYIALNNTVAPFDNVKVRQALNYAMDRATMVAISYDGLAEEAWIMADERAFGVDMSDCNTFSYDPEKAKALLAEAGYPNGIDFGADFGIQMDIIAGGYFEKFAQVFQQNLADIGCKIELRASETYSTDAASGNYAIMTQGMTFQYDASYLEGLYGTVGIDSKNHARYSNPEVDELFAKADATTDQDERAAYFKQITEIVYNDCPTLCVLHRQIPYAWAKDLSAKPHAPANHPYYIYEWSWN